MCYQTLDQLHGSLLALLVLSEFPSFARLELIYNFIDSVLSKDIKAEFYLYNVA